MIRRCALLPCLLACAAPASAALFVFDESVIPANPVNTFGSFAYGGFAGAAVTDGPTSLTIDSTSFGGVGVDYVVPDPANPGSFIPQDFDRTTHQLELRIKVLDGNAATVINAVLAEDDGAGIADEFQYNFGLAGVPADGEFHLLTTPLPLMGPSFVGGNGDDLFNPGLRQIQIQSEFGSIARLHVEVDFLRIAPIAPEVPEPSACLLAIAAAASAAARRRVAC